jgi:anti-sigma regulatory factor (Ser/Thr protein kinase)
VAGSFQFKHSATLKNLKEFRAFVQKSGAALEVRTEILGDLGLIVDEAVTNIVVHGYADNGGPVEILMERDGDELQIVIRDRAPYFDADRVESPHLDEPLARREFGGMGVYLIRKLSDEAEFDRRPGGGNELRMRWRSAFA